MRWNETKPPHTIQNRYPKFPEASISLNMGAYFPNPGLSLAILEIENLEIGSISILFRLLPYNLILFPAFLLLVLLPADCLGQVPGQPSLAGTGVGS